MKTASWPLAAAPSFRFSSRVVVVTAATLALAVGLGVLATASGFLALAAVAALVCGIALATSPDRLVPIVLVLIWANVAAIGIKEYGAPQTAALVPPLLLGIPFAARLARKAPVVVTPVLLAMVVLLLAEIVSTIPSIDMTLAFDRVRSFLVEGLLLYFLVTNVVRTPAALRTAVWAIVGAGAFVALLAVVQYAFGMYDNSFGGFAQVSESQLERDQPRVGGPIGEKNYFAQMLLVLIPLGLALAWNERRPLARIAAFAATIAVAFGVTLTFSRGAAVAFAAMIVVGIALRYLRVRHAVAIALGVTALLLVVPGYKERVLSLRQVAATTEEAGSTRVDVSLRGRTSEMLAAAHAFSDHPYIGVGPGLFRLYYVEYADRLGMRIHNEERYAHNLYLQLAAELGVFGLAAFLTIIALAVVELERARRRARAAGDRAAMNMVAAFLTAVVAYLVTGAFLSLAYERYFWLLLALAGAAAHLARRDAARTEARRA